MKEAIGQKSIADELGISVNTVSRALRDCDDVNPKTKEKVRQKAIEIGYMYNTVSQFIKKNEKRLVTIITTAIYNPFFYIICQKVFNYIGKNDDYNVSIIYSTTLMLVEDDVKKCILSRSDVIVSLIPVKDGAVDIAKLNNLPIILIGHHSKNAYIHQIYSDDTAGGTLAADYLFEKAESDNYLYCAIACSPSDLRYNAFRARIQVLCPDANITYLANTKHIFECLNYAKKQNVFFFNDDLLYSLIQGHRSETSLILSMNIIGYDALSNSINGLIDIPSVEFNFDYTCKEIIKILARIKGGETNQMIAKVPVSLHKPV